MHQRQHLSLLPDKGHTLVLMHTRTCQWHKYNSGGAEPALQYHKMRSAVYDYLWRCSQFYSAIESLQNYYLQTLQIPKISPINIGLLSHVQLPSIRL